MSFAPIFRRVPRLAAAALVLTVALPAAASPTVEQVLAYYRTEAFLDQGLKQFEDALARRRKAVTVPEARVQELKSWARKIYRGKNLLDAFKHAYAKAITLEQMTATHAWQISIKGILYRKGLEEFHRTPARSRQAYLEKEGPLVLKPNRVNAINSFVNVSEQANLLTTFMVGADFGVYMALDAYQPKANRDTVKYLKEKIRAHRTGYLETARKEAYESHVYVFKALKNAEIDEITKAMAKADLQAANKAYVRALEITLDGAATTLAKQIEKSL